ncbi:hypothetical protein GGF50DRAFT_127257 [Schizophyllum commune]
MSSRTAAGRRRLQSGQVQTISPTLLSPKALFGFRSKSKDQRRTPRSSPTPPSPQRPSVHFTPSTDDSPSIRQRQASEPPRSDEQRNSSHPRPPPSPIRTAPLSPLPPSSPRSRSTMQLPPRAESASSAWRAEDAPAQEDQAPISHATRTGHLRDKAPAGSPAPRAPLSPGARNALYFDDSMSLSPVSSPERTPSEFLAPGPYGGENARSPATSIYSLAKAPSATSSSSSKRSIDSKRSMDSDFVTSPDSPTKFVFPSGRSVVKPKGPGPKFGRKTPKTGTRVESPALTPVGSRTSTETVAADLRRTRAMSTSTATSSGTAISAGTSRSGSSTDTAAPAFVFPTSRTRANPAFRPAVRLTPKIPVRRGRARELAVGSEERDYSPMENTLSSAAGNRESVATATERRLRARSIHLRVGEYPFDQYNAEVQKWERSTHELLRSLKPPDSPCFYDYGHLPPMTVLDLGCGQGWWMLEAAHAWRGHGTQVIGFDLVDTTSEMCAQAVRLGLSDNMRVIVGSFLTKPLPFEDETFDLVRMADLTYAIPFDQWEQVLREAKRVLAIGGRLELIDDDIFFPYSDTTLLPVQPWSYTLSPPSRSHSPQSRRTTTTSYVSSLHSGFDTVSETESNTLYTDSFITNADTETISSPRKPPDAHTMALRTASEEVEALFGYMVNHKLGLNLRLHAFLFDALKRIFGGLAREVDTMRLGVEGPPSTASGLVLWPSTCIPMRAADVEQHAMRHCRTVLMCKELMTEYALEVSNEEDVDDETISEALWDYAVFLPQRFSMASSKRESVCTIKRETVVSRATRRDSTASMESSLDALMEYQSEFRGMFASTPSDDEDDSQGVGCPAPEVNESNHKSYERIADLTHIRTIRVFEAVKTAP